MRKPVQVLVLPYRHCKNKIQFALFKRADLNVWQGIAGGVEEGESVFEACKREANEEAGIPFDTNFIKLDSKSNLLLLLIKQIAHIFYLFLLEVSNQHELLLQTK